MLRTAKNSVIIQRASLERSRLFKKIMKNLHHLLLFTLTILLSSCVAPMDNPKAASIKVNEYLAFGDGVILKRYTLPEGVYPYNRTIREGHLYQSPEPGTLRDTGIPFKQEGGILWRHGKAGPDRLYRRTIAGFLAFMPASDMGKSITVSTDPAPPINMEKK